MTKRFENRVPFEDLYQPSLKEASRKKPVFFIHKYFARRITANFRTALLDYLYDDNDIISHYYAPSNQKGRGITILDPFMGGGTTIFEALRFGCNVIGNDLQPLSLFVTKSLIEPLNEEDIKNAVAALQKNVGNRIKDYYKTKCPSCGNQADGMYAFHVKTVSANSSCSQHQLYSSFIIAYKKDEFTVVCPKCGELHKTKFENGYFECSCGWILKNPKESYIKNGAFECPECHERKVLSEYSREQGYPFATKIIAIEYCCPYCGAHDYKAPDQSDIQLYQKALDDFQILGYLLPIPDQDIPQGYNTNQILNHGYRKFRDLFNPRQLLCLGLLLQEINKIENKHTQLWLQLAFSGMLEMNNMFCRYQQNAYKICNIFFNHAYVPISMPVENCVWGAALGTGTFEKTIQKILRGKKFNQKIYDLSVNKLPNGRYDSVQIENGDTVGAMSTTDMTLLDSQHPVLRCSDSKNLSFIPDESVDLVLTDPPYGANVMYSELIDFFHVWNYHSSIAKDLGFTTPLSPKSEEIVVNPVAGKDFTYYQDGITAVLAECYRKTKKDGYLAFSFHDKSIDSWLAVLESIYKAGFVLKKCYPVQAETRTGAHTSGKNSIGIDIMLISKKTPVSSIQLQLLSDGLLNLVIEQTKIKVIDFLNRFQKVDAELTAPDIQNIAIAVFFTELENFNAYDENSKRVILEKLKNLLNNIENIAGDFAITQKRDGWWSELYRQKWNV